MKRIFSYLFAILFAVGTTGVFTSCQEDAVEIDYTISVTVNNDLTEVINAINNGTFADPSEAIQSLVDAINKLSGDQETKFKALQDAINGLATTLDAKIAVLEAAMKAQTVTLEGKIGAIEAAIKALPDYTEKLGALEAAIKALPDYTEKLGAIEAAIKALPDYSTKLAAIETAIKNIPDYSEKLAAIEDAIKNAPDYTAALEEIKSAIAALPDYSEQLGAIITAVAALPDYSEQLGLIQAAVEAIPDYTEKLTAIQTALEAIKQQNSDNATAIAALQASIAAIAKAVEEGNKNQEDALAEILALLETIDRTIKTEYVTFTADAAQTLSYEGSDLQYSTDGTTFLALPANTPIEFGGNTKLYLRGVNNLDGNSYVSSGITWGYQISFGNDDVPVACTGDIRTLIDYATYKTVDTSNAIFAWLFCNCTELTSAPALPATTLAGSCYWAMFYGCTSLEDAPALPATTLMEECYYEMFEGCTRLNEITMLATDISATDCLKNWVKDVAATGTFKKDASMTSLPTGDSGIPSGWTVQ